MYVCTSFWHKMELDNLTDTVVVFDVVAAAFFLILDLFWSPRFYLAKQKVSMPLSPFSLPVFSLCSLVCSPMIHTERAISLHNTQHWPS